MRFDFFFTCSRGVAFFAREGGCTFINGSDIEIIHFKGDLLIAIIKVIKYID